MKVISYIDQLTVASEEYGVSLDDAAHAIGIAGTTLWRWRARDAEPKLATTRALVAYMRTRAEDAA